MHQGGRATIAQSGFRVSIQRSGYIDGVQVFTRRNAFNFALTFERGFSPRTWNEFVDCVKGYSKACMANDRLQQQLQNALDQAVKSADELCTSQTYRAGTMMTFSPECTARLLISSFFFRVLEARTLYQVNGHRRDKVSQAARQSG